MLKNNFGIQDHSIILNKITTYKEITWEHNNYLKNHQQNKSVYRFCKEMKRQFYFFIK